MAKARNAFEQTEFDSGASLPGDGISAAIAIGPQDPPPDDEDPVTVVPHGPLFITGTWGNDTLYGSDWDDVIDGLGGNDTIYGFGGNDTIISGSVYGGSYLDGGDGNDSLLAYEGNDTLVGGAGDDYLFAGNGSNVLDGGAGADMLVGGLDADIMFGGDGDDFLFGNGGGDILIGGDGNDWLSAGDGPAVLFGGDGFDTVSYGSSWAAVSVNLLDMRSNTGDAAGQVYIGIENFSLSNFDDTFIGSNLADIANGAFGNDTLYGNDGADILDGGAGNDWLDGGDGDDVLHGGTGADILSGGDGFDIAAYYDATAGVSIDLTRSSLTWTGEAQGDVLSSIEEVDLTEFADIFRGNANDNFVFGGSGDDQISGLAGNDTLNGGYGNDSLFGGDGNDVVYGDSGWRHGGDDYLQGNAGDDILFGGAGNDRMVGGTGNDILIGGGGSDYLVGNEGADIFRFAAVTESQHRLSWDPQQADQIVDFTQGQDRIDLSLIDANVSLEGDQSFTFLADPAHYTGDWSGLVWQTTDSRTGIATLNVSIDADPGADMQIYMSHPYTFTANDFIL
ncbi:MAG: calcium-binding protein [Bradyrhizobium sp.]